MRSNNSFTLTGRVGQEPETKSFNSGAFITKFSLAVPRDRKDQDGNYPTDWFYCDAWGGEKGGPGNYISKYVNKGSLVTVGGSLLVETWADPETKQKRSRMVLNVTSVQGLGGKGEASSAAGDSGLDEELPAF